MMTLSLLMLTLLPSQGLIFLGLFPVIGINAKDWATCRRLSVTLEVKSSKSAVTEGLELRRELHVP